MGCYFAYGSNLDPAQMKERCPSARFRCVATLRNRRLAFTRKSTLRNCGVADVVPQPGHDVWGVVYQMDESDLPRLDVKEGYHPERPPNSYVREEMVVYANGDDRKPVTVVTYVAVKQEAPSLPNQAYKDQILEGARRWGLPEPYIRELESIEVHPVPADEGNVAAAATP